MNTIELYGDVGVDWYGEGISAAGVSEQLSGMTGDVTVRINSYGGDAYEGLAIYNLIRNYSGEVTTINDGMAASAASVIFAAGDLALMPQTSVLMIHQPWTYAAGSSTDLRQAAAGLDAAQTAIINAYQQHTNISDEEVVELLVAETYMNADKAVALGFADDLAVTEKDTSQNRMNTNRMMSVMNQQRPWVRRAPPEDVLPTSVLENSLWRVALRNRRMQLISSREPHCRTNELN